MADEPELEDRVERLENDTGQIKRMVEQLVGTGSKAHAVAQEHEERKLDRPTEVGDMVRMELDRAEQEKAAKAEKEREKSEQQQIKEAVAKLTEQKPAQPQRRVERGVWGPR